MPRPAPRKSQRFTNAARAERDRLAKRRSQLFAQREDLQAKVDALDEELEAIDSEITVLENLATPAEKRGELSGIRAVPREDANLISGRQIRSLAVPLLMRERSNAPIHYREWFALLGDQGYRVAGKRPDAVFLNQVSRSPLVRATTRSGYYELDLDVVDTLRDKLRRQQTELSGLIAQMPTGAEGFERRRMRQRELNAAIARTERELNEAMSALEAAKSTPEQHERHAA
jgi:outer membrane murein-binding lipoprotein Lpp